MNPQQTLIIPTVEDILLLGRYQRAELLLALSREEELARFAAADWSPESAAAAAAAADWIHRLWGSFGFAPTSVFSIQCICERSGIL